MNNEQTSTCTEAAPLNAQPRLSGRDREIALQAIAARASGTPVEAAYQILAGIEALDAGPESPLVMLWPKGDGYETLEDKAAWHEAERDRLLDRHKAFSRAFPSWRRQETGSPGSQHSPDGDQGRSGLHSSPLPGVEAVQVHDAEPSKDLESSSLSRRGESSRVSGLDEDAQA
ncbi:MULTISPECIES: hypothetical protein [unclassified Pseudomonas]|uniref:hypothetical protein n=1 Tax=unclassified Pseudomonas TaxID=196821 RepID=UPI001112E760|nr:MULTISPECIES: hypothetical protein [unclassified Pseudomonas]